MYMCQKRKICDRYRIYCTLVSDIIIGLYDADSQRIV